MDLGKAKVGGVEADAVLEDLLGRVAAGQGHRMELASDVDHEEGEVVDGRKVTGIG